MRLQAWTAIQTAHRTSPKCSNGLQRKGLRLGAFSGNGRPGPSTASVVHVFALRFLRANICTTGVNEAPGLGCDPSRGANESKMLKWLAAQGIKAGGIQKEWQAGAIKDGNIAFLIRYAAAFYPLEAAAE